MTTPKRPTQTIVPIVEEQLRVDKRVERVGAVRVRVEVDEVEQAGEVETFSDEVQIERLSRDTPADAHRAPWTEGDVLVVPVYEERLVTELRLVLTEEIHIRRQRKRTRQQVNAPLRKERAVVERLQADGSWVEDPVPAQGPPGG